MSHVNMMIRSIRSTPLTDDGLNQAGTVGIVTAGVMAILLFLL